MADVVETSSNGERACVELSSSYVAEGTKVDGGGMGRGDRDACTANVMATCV